MIRAIDDVQRSSRLESCRYGREQPKVRQGIPGSLEEEHRQMHRGEVVGTAGGRLAGGVQREAEKDQPAHAGQRRGGLRARRHAAAEGLAAREERQTKDLTRRRDRCRPNRRLRERGTVGPEGACFPRRKLEAQRRHPPRREPVGDSREERVRHAGPCPVRQRQAGERIPRHAHECGHAVRRIDVEGELRFVVLHRRPA